MANPGFTEIGEQSAPNYLFFFLIIFFYQALQAKPDEAAVLVIPQCGKISCPGFQMPHLIQGISCPGSSTSQDINPLTIMSNFMSVPGGAKQHNQQQQKNFLKSPNSRDWSRNSQAWLCCISSSGWEHSGAVEVFLKHPRNLKRHFLIAEQLLNN